MGGGGSREGLHGSHAHTTEKKPLCDQMYRPAVSGGTKANPFRIKTFKEGEKLKGDVMDRLCGQKEPMAMADLALNFLPLRPTISPRSHTGA